MHSNKLHALVGLVLFLAPGKIKFNSGNTLKYGLIVFTILFPLVFVIFEKSNLYSSWRQFLFIYPGIVLLAATGYFGKALKIDDRDEIIFFNFAAALYNEGQHRKADSLQGL